MAHMSPKKPDPDEPKVWRDTQHEKQPEQRTIRSEAGPEGQRRTQEKMLPQDADLGDVPEKEEEMLPRDAQQVRPPDAGGEEPDTAGRHGRMAPEAAKGLDEPASGSK